MKINVVAVGKIKDKHFEQAVLEYAKMLSRFCDLNIREVAEAAPSKTCAEQLADEGARILQCLSGYVVALDKDGENLSSEQFAALLDKKATEGQSAFTFVIGGSNGLCQSVKARADIILSFGAMTFPHRLFRVMLLEQIYRALSINAGLPYHK
jgi:23S rRNA (pseudouridine1915-N3)-methyltransferase